MTAFEYNDRRVLVIGGATGMGAAAAKTVAGLGAEVLVMDVRESDGQDASRSAVMEQTTNRNGHRP